MDTQQPAPPDPLGMAIWAQYSKERYDAAEKRLADFRSWARQLAAAVGVVVGLEAALMSQVVGLGEESPFGLAVCLILLAGSVAYQLAILGRAVKKGYVGQESLGPESPLVLADHVSGESATRRMIGAYYAQGSETVHTVAESVVREVAGLARGFVWSLWLFFAGMVLTGGLMAVSSHARKVMADTPSSNDAAPSGPAPSSDAPAAPAPSSSPASPSGPGTSPLLATPTPGRPETRSPAGEVLTATPTPGQRVTEGAGGERK
jgi:hypothetical protein